ncbi:MAG: RidA family protein [Neomegalonema sp.]|nr:RidA family protein [Neomegalonema sp.]
MSRKLISSGSPFEAKIGYSRAVVQGNWCFVAGTTGYDYAAMAMPQSAAEQTRNALGTIEKALIEGGFTMSDVVRARYYLTSTEIYDEIVPVLGSVFGEIRPAATMVVCGLTMPEMKIEIEVDALKSE